MNIRLIGAFAFTLAAACDSAPADKATGGDTGDAPDTDTTPVTDCPSGTFTGPILVQQATVSCDASDIVTYDVRTDGWTGDGLVNAMETANLSPWDDEHDLLSYEYDACGFEDNLQVMLSTGAPMPSANQSTLFTCASHFDDSNGVMTYAARVYDLDQNFADCLAWGHDPVGYTNGLYDGACINCPTRPAEITQCVTARRAR